MSGYSNARKDLILDATMGGTAYSELVGSRWLGLATVAITGADTGATVIEPTWTGYARIPIANADWNPSALGVKTNKNVMAFAEATAGEDTHLAWFVADKLEVGKGLIVCSGIVPPTLITKGIAPKFKIGALSYSLIDT